ncbi:hypothetical protein [Pectobacterium aroidearum]|nr:hypothetical protein [Pectobacterium aroidearum]UUE75489.1 hypothetical protein L0Y20_03655 [Pectobacterium aroidearum]
MNEPKGMKPLASTVRVVEWGRTATACREIPADFNPLADGVLMAHFRSSA